MTPAQLRSLDSQLEAFTDNIFDGMAGRTERAVLKGRRAVTPPLDSMHMHVHIHAMRTTVEITDVQRAELLRLAAERGEKGFSRLVQEAIDEFLQARNSTAERTELALAALGTLSDSAGDRIQATARELRNSWR